VAGLTTAIVLGRAGFEVVCVDPDPRPVWRVGESLDWSARPLLERLGLPITDLVGCGLATYKREVGGHTTDGQDMVGRPYPWLLRRPFHFERDTVHLERGRFDRALHDAALTAGVRIDRDAVTEVRTSGDRITHCLSRSGTTYAGDWYVDATGRARVIGRAAGVTTTRWSERRIAIWAYCEGKAETDGTTLHLDTTGKQLEWVWEIPVGPDTLSVGAVMAADAFRNQRQRRGTPASIFEDALARFPTCERFAGVDWRDMRSRTYRGYVSDRVCGPNWLLAGEAACFVDPLTSIGVTSAMRHGCEAAEAIIEATRHPERASGLLERYERRATGMARLYNEGVELLLYDERVRRSLGARWAVRAYVTMGYATTSLYGRLPVTTKRGTAAVGGVLAAFRLWIRAWTAAARAARRVSPRRGRLGGRLPAPAEHGTMPTSRAAPG
jgi:FADH2-dependent halogenase/halogenation protein CepH